MPELATDLSHAITRRAAQIGVLTACQRAIGHYTALLQTTMVELTQDLPVGLQRWVGDEVALALRLSPWTGRDLLDEARLMATVPAVWALMSDGTLSAGHARKLAGPLLALGEADRARVLALVLPKLKGQTPHQLSRIVDAAILTLDLDAAEDRRQRAVDARDVRAFPTTDGQAALHAAGPAEQVAAIMAALDAMTWPRQPDDDRTAAQRRFDLLLDLTTGGAQPGQWEAQIIVPIGTADGSTEDLAEIPGMGKVLPSVARQLIAHAGMRRLTVDPISGQLLDLDDIAHHPDLPSEPGPVGPRPSADTEPEPPTTPDQDTIDQHDLIWWASQADSTNSADPADPAADAIPRDELPPPHTDTDVAPPVEAEVDDQTDAADRAWLAQHWDTAAALEDQDTRNELYLVTHGLQRTPVTMLLPADEQTAADHRQLGPTWSDQRLRQVLQRMRLQPPLARDLSTDRYTLPRKLRRFLHARDLTCTFPGCGRHARRCDKDHLLPWPRGRTHPENLACECEHHHQGKHAYFTVQRLPGGTLRWTTPAGLTYDRQPRSLLH